MSAMRLYLTIEHDGDRPEKFVWLVHEDQQLATIEDLGDYILGEVLAFPSDFELLIDDYICMSHETVADLLRDGDKVTLRCHADPEPALEVQRRSQAIESYHDQDPSEDSSEDPDHKTSGIDPEESRTAAMNASKRGKSVKHPVTSQRKAALNAGHQRDATESYADETVDMDTSEHEHSHQSRSGSEEESEDGTSDLTSSDEDSGQDDVVSPPTEDTSQDASRSGSLSASSETENMFVGIPGEGKRRTIIRNRRRVRVKRLKYLKSIGELHPDAGLADLEAYDAGGDLEARKQELLDDMTDGGSPEQLSSRDVETHKRKHSTAFEQDEEAEQDDTRNNITLSMSEEAADVTAHFLESRAPRTKRLDLASTNRLVFGALGVRAPRSQQEKDAVREKLRQGGLSNGQGKLNGSNATQSIQTDHTDQQGWRSRIKLSAVECSTGEPLSTPPFPFQQHWHKKQQQQSQYQDHEELDEVYHSNDDSIDVDLDECFPEMPALPDDITTLPLLVKPTEQDFIVFKQLDCSAETGYEPAIVTRRAQVRNYDKDTEEVRLEIDLQALEYDEEGNIIRGKLDMPEFEEGDDGIRIMQWSELIEPRLLQRPATVQ